MKSRIVISILLGILVCTSCSTVSQSGYRPDVSQLNISLNDLDYLGETEISVDFETYLGIFSTIKSINGADYDPARTTRGEMLMSSRSHGRLLPMLNRAAYAIFEQYPQAEYFIVTRQYSEQNILFLGRETRNTAKVSVYRFKR